jgi:DNA uptake protein ComE-like DNA-binding protein
VRIQKEKIVDIPTDSNECAAIHLNSASKETLAALPRVGPKRAEALVRNRPFRSWDQIKGVPSLGKATIENLRSQGVDLDGAENAKWKVFWSFPCARWKTRCG